jgi:uncharacterized protein DUF6174
MACGAPLKFSTTVTGGEITHVTVPDGMKKRAAPTVEGLFTLLESYGRDASDIRYNKVGVPLAMHLDHPEMSDDEGTYKVQFFSFVFQP